MIPDTDLYPRQAAPLLTEALTDSPAVLIHGPRQCGNATLARMVAEPPGLPILHLRRRRRAAGAEIDRQRKPGRFILTGSTNVLLLPRLSDSLAGRMEILRLHPLAQCELARTPSGFLDALFSGDFQTRH